MKLKQLSTDFIVEEIPNIEISQEKDEHAIFLLEKKEIDTFDAIRLIAKKLRVPLFEIGYAGLKDRHALAKQYISIPTHYKIIDAKIDTLNIQLVGYNRKKIKIGDLNGNKFTIAVRDVKENELENVSKRAGTISCSGVPNYFDSQRFGSVIHNEFIIKDIIKQQYEQAVKKYLTFYLKSESKKIKDEKRRILAQWNNLENAVVQNKVFSAVIEEYLKTKSWLAAYKKIPAHLREMFVNAYQSYIWNECVKEVLKKCVEKKKLYPVEYAVGSLLFYKDLSEQEIQKIPSTFGTASDKVNFSEYEKNIINDVLSREGIALTDLAIDEKTGNFFKTRARSIIIIPENFIISNPVKDELNSNKKSKYKIEISFSLSKGSYATIVTKRLFGH
jgi:tRNA pseudouridine13 synthase